MAKYVYGIDLGTTYSCIARINDNGSPEVIKNKEGINTTPSVVFFDNKEIVVGRVAKENTILEPENTVSFVKTLMGKSDFAINYDGRDITPAEISSYILRKVANDAADITGQEVKDVVITVPAYFGTAERDATKKAGELAGLNVLSIISEPVAAAIYYGATNQTEEKNILIYDLGGGTFDVTVMNIKPGTIEVICAEGNHDLGGKNWDGNIQAYLEEQFRENYREQKNEDFDGELENCDLQELASKAEKAKMELTERGSTKIMMAFQGFKTKAELTREKFDELTKEYLDLTIELTDKAIEIAKNKGINIDQILLVGGSTRMPQVSSILKSKYGLEPAILDPDEAVAKGAAIYATDVYINGKDDLNITNSGDATEEPPRLYNTIGGSGGDNQNASTTIIFSTTKSYGIKAQSEEDGKVYIFNQILKNNPLPGGSITVSNRFGVSVNNQQNALIEIYESDSDKEQMTVIEDLKLGDAILDLPPGMTKNRDLIILTLTLDSGGNLHVHGEAELNGVRKEADANLVAKGIISEEAFKKIKEEMDSSGLVMQK